MFVIFSILRIESFEGIVEAFNIYFSFDLKKDNMLHTEIHPKRRTVMLHTIYWTSLVI